MINDAPNVIHVYKGNSDLNYCLHFVDNWPCFYVNTFLNLVAKSVQQVRDDNCELAHSSVTYLRKRLSTHFYSLVMVFVGNLLSSTGLLK